MAVLYANVSPLHKPHCTTDRDDDREGGEVRERLVCSAMGQWKEGRREGGGGQTAIQGPPLSQCGKNPSPTWWSEGGREGALFAYSRARRPLMSDRASGRGMNKCRRSKGDAVAVRFGSIGRTTRNYGQIRYLKGARGSSLILLPSLLPPARQHFVAEQRQLPAICLPSTTFTGILSLSPLSRIITPVISKLRPHHSLPAHIT